MFLVGMNCIALYRDTAAGSQTRTAPMKISPYIWYMGVPPRFLPQSYLFPESAIQSPSALQQKDVTKIA